MTLLSVMALSSMLVGCVALPVPNCRVEGHGVTSQVIDAETGRPVPSARVSDARNDREAVVAGADGRFTLEPHVQWHLGYQFGAIPFPIWPTTGDMFIPSRCIRIRAAGYEETDFSLSSCHGPAQNEKERCNLPVQGDLLLVPPLPIRREGRSPRKN
jgi:hypothetical protein